MTREAKVELVSLAGFVGLVLIGLGLGWTDETPRRAPGPDLEAALAACREDLVVHHAAGGKENNVRPWTERAPGDSTRRAR